MSDSSNSGNSISDLALHLQSLYPSWEKTQRQTERFYQWLCCQQSVYPSWKKKRQQSSNISFFINDYNIREQLLWAQWHYQWWFYSIIVYLSFVKADLAIKHEIFSFAAVTIHSMMDKSTYWHSVSLCERFLKQWSSSILLWWKGTTFYLCDITICPLDNPFMRTAQKLFVSNNNLESMRSTEDLLWWRRKTFYLCCSNTYSANNPFMECYHLSLVTYC